MGFIQKHRKKIPLLLGLLAFVLFLLIYPYLTVELTIKNFYKDESKTGDIFVNNLDIVKGENFTQEIEVERLEFGWFRQKYAVFYKAEDYRGLDQAVVADYFYLYRTYLSWGVGKYETSYLPYIENSETSFDDAYDSFKKDVLSGKYKSGLTPAQEKELDGQVGDKSFRTDSPDKTHYFEFSLGSGDDFNYLKIDGKEYKDIKNVSNAVWSLDSKSIVYTEGEYNKVLGELEPLPNIWYIDLSGNKKNLYTSDDEPNDVSLFSDGQYVIYGTKDTIGMIDIATAENTKLLDYAAIDTQSEEFLLAEVYSYDSAEVLLRVPQDKVVYKNYKFDLATKTMSAL